MSFSIGNLYKSRVAISTVRSGEMSGRKLDAGALLALLGRESRSTRRGFLVRYRFVSVRLGHIYSMIKVIDPSTEERMFERMFLEVV